MSVIDDRQRRLITPEDLQATRRRLHRREGTDHLGEGQTAAQQHAGHGQKVVDVEASDQRCADGRAAKTGYQREGHAMLTELELGGLEIGAAGDR